MKGMGHLSSRRILIVEGKPGRKKLKRTISTRGEPEQLQMMSEYTGRCSIEDAW